MSYKMHKEKKAYIDENTFFKKTARHIAVFIVLWCVLVAFCCGACAVIYKHCGMASEFFAVSTMAIVLVTGMLFNMAFHIQTLETYEKTWL